MARMKIKTYKEQKFDHLKGLDGISDKQLEEHFALYTGYVKQVNALNEELVKLRSEGKASGKNPEFAELTRLITGHGEISNDWPNLPYLRRFVQGTRFFDCIGNDNAAIIYSSGSTGRPKGILIAHRNLAEGADIVAEYLGTREDDRIGSVLSLNFDYGLNQLWQTLRLGCTLYLHELALPNAESTSSGLRMSND